MNSAAREFQQDVGVAKPGWAARITRDRMLKRIAALPAGRLIIEDADGNTLELMQHDDA